MLSFILFACSTQPLVEGTVHDIWNNPIEGAEVLMENVDQPNTTNSAGAFSFPITEGKTMRFRASKEGFVPVVGETSAATGEGAKISLSMYPTVESNGFWLINTDKYTPLPASNVDKKGAENQHILGVYDVGSVSINQPRPSFVFRSTLRKEQLAQIDLEIHKLTFVDSTKFNSLTGLQDVEIDLWVPETQAKFVIKDLGAQDHFLIEISDPLPQGVYAFHSYSILNPQKNVDTSSLPKELMKVFPFEIK